MACWEAGDQRRSAVTHPPGTQSQYRRTPLSSEEKARGEANLAPFVAQMLVARGRFRVSADTPDQVELFQGVARRVSDMLQRPVASYANGREIVITFGQQEAPALALRSPSWPCRGWPASGPGRLPPGPYLLTGVSAETPVSKRVHSPGTLHLCSAACGHSPALRLEGRTRTFSGPSADLSPARTLAPSACMPAAPSGMAGGSSCPGAGAWHNRSRLGRLDVCCPVTELEDLFLQGLPPSADDEGECRAS
jgi:hypothetical protein